MKQIMPLWMLKYLPNMPACHVGIAFNAHGPNNSVVLGDVSGPAAVIEAVSCIERGIAKLMIAGATGTRISTTRLNYRGDLPIPELFDPIEFSSRPHDPTSKGVVGGEGAASLVLETSAARRSARHQANRSDRLLRLAICSLTGNASMHSGPTIRMISELADLPRRFAWRLRRRWTMPGFLPSRSVWWSAMRWAIPSCDAAEREAIEATLAERRWSRRLLRSATPGRLAA